MKTLFKILILLIFPNIFLGIFADPISPVPKPENHMCTTDGKFCQDANWQTDSPGPSYWTGVINCPNGNNVIPMPLIYQLCDSSSCVNKGKLVYMFGILPAKTPPVTDTPYPNVIMDMIENYWCSLK